MKLVVGEPAKCGQVSSVEVGRDEGYEVKPARLHHYLVRLNSKPISGCLMWPSCRSYSVA